MSKTIEQLVGDINRLTSIETIKGGLPRTLPEPLYRVGGRVVGNKAEYGKFTGQRKAAPVVQYGADPVTHTPNGKGTALVTLIHSFTDMPIDPQAYINLRSDSEVIQNIGLDAISREVMDHLLTFQNLRTKALVSAFSKGAIWVSSAGELQVSSSGAASTVDYGVTTTDTVSASWATASTDIIGDINGWKRAALVRNNYPLRYALYGKNIAGYIAANTAAKELIHGNPATAQAFYNTGEIPNGFCGLTWIPVYDTYTIDSSGSAESWFGDKQITLMADPAEGWYGGIIEGSKPVNKNTGRTADTADQVMLDFTHQFGMFSFSYAPVGPNPKISQIAGDTFLPAIKNGGCVSIVADVTTP